MTYLEDQDQRSVIAPIFEILQGDKRERKRLTLKLLSKLDSDMNIGQVKSKLEVNIFFAKFILGAIYYLDFALQSDVLNVIAGIDQVLARSGLLWLQHLEGFDPHQILLTGQKSRIFCMMYFARQQLRHGYALTEARCQSFDLSKAVTAVASRPATRKHTSQLKWDEWIDMEINTIEAAQVAIQKVNDAYFDDNNSNCAAHYNLGWKKQRYSDL